MLSLTLLKVKLLLDLMRRNAALAIAGRRLPEELLQKVLDNIPPSPIIQPNKAIMSAADLSPVIKEMENQVEHLYVMIEIMDPLI